MTALPIWKSADALIAQALTARSTSDVTAGGVWVLLIPFQPRCPPGEVFPASATPGNGRWVSQWSVLGSSRRIGVTLLRAKRQQKIRGSLGFYSWIREDF